MVFEAYWSLSWLAFVLHSCVLHWIGGRKIASHQIFISNLSSSSCAVNEEAHSPVNANLPYYRQGDQQMNEHDQQRLFVRSP